MPFGLQVATNYTMPRWNLTKCFPDYGFMLTKKIIGKIIAFVRKCITKHLTLAKVLLKWEFALLFEVNEVNFRLTNTVSLQPGKPK